MNDYSNATVIARHIQITDNIKVSTLSTLDKIRLLLSKVSTDDASELDAITKVNNDKLRKLAAMSQFVDEVIKQMNLRKVNSVTVVLPSDFKPFIGELQDTSKSPGKFYEFIVKDVEIPIGIEYRFPVTIMKRDTTKRRL